MFRPHLHPVAVLLALAALVAGAPPALADEPTITGTISYDAATGTLAFDASAGAGRHDVTYANPTATSATFADDAATTGPTLGSGAGGLCTVDAGTHVATCTVPDLRAVVVTLGPGDDDAVVHAGDAPGDVPVTWTLGAGNDHATLASEPDGVVAGDGDDVVRTGGGADHLVGGAGDDRLQPGAGTDVVEGGDGSDTVDYSDHSAGVVVPLGGTAGAAGEADAIGGDVENAVGGSGPDVLVGTAGSNTLDGGPGADSLVGGGGVDALLGGAGNDAIDARDGVGDYVDCGRNPVTATEGDDDAAVVDYVDVLLPGTCERVSSTVPPQVVARPVPTTGADVLFGTDGNDTWHALAGDDTVWGGAGNDVVFGEVGDDVLHGGPGNDVLDGGPGADVLSGSAGNDTLRGQAGTDYLIGGTGLDVLQGGAGNDVLVLRDGRRGDVGDCGAGRDVAVVDAGDKPRHCEKVIVG